MRSHTSAHYQVKCSDGTVALLNGLWVDSDLVLAVQYTIYMPDITKQYLQHLSEMVGHETFYEVLKGVALYTKEDENFRLNAFYVLYLAKKIEGQRPVSEEMTAERMIIWVTQARMLNEYSFKVFSDYV